MPEPERPQYKLTPRVLGRLLAMRETVGQRRAMKRYLHDNCGGRGDAAELNRVLRALDKLSGPKKAEVRRIADDWIAGRGKGKASRGKAKTARRAGRRT